jgi:hypothetical protein
VLTEHRSDLPPAVDPAQVDLPTRHEPEEQDLGTGTGFSVAVSAST